MTIVSHVVVGSKALITKIRSGGYMLSLEIHILLIVGSQEKSLCEDYIKKRLQPQVTNLSQIFDDLVKKGLLGCVIKGIPDKGISTSYYITQTGQNHLMQIKNTVGGNPLLLKHFSNVK